LDVSPVAIGLARDFASLNGFADRCRFEVADLEEGVPTGSAADVILLHLFWDERLAGQIIERLASGGLLAIAAQSEADVGPGPFRLRPFELADALGEYGQLDILETGERFGKTWCLARRG